MEVRRRVIVPDAVPPASASTKSPAASTSVAFLCTLSSRLCPKRNRPDFSTSQHCRKLTNTKIHLVAADARTAIAFSLSPGNDHDAPQGRLLLEQLGPMPEGLPMLMDRAYEGDETRQLVLDLGMIPVVPPKSNRLTPWEYDRALYKKRNEIERLFRRLKGFRRIFSRFEKLDVVFLAFLHFALIVEALRLV